jgi:hypothetical protein
MVYLSLAGFYVDICIRRGSLFSFQGTPNDADPGPPIDPRHAKRTSVVIVVIVVA